MRVKRPIGTNLKGEGTTLAGLTTQLRIDCDRSIPLKYNEVRDWFPQRNMKYCRNCGNTAYPVPVYSPEGGVKGYDYTAKPHRIKYKHLTE